MEDSQYQKIQAAIIEVAKITRGLNLLGFISKINHAETVGPMLDPTLYRKAQARLVLIKKLATILLELQPITDELMTVVLEEEFKKYEAEHGVQT